LSPASPLDGLVSREVVVCSFFLNEFRTIVLNKERIMWIAIGVITLPIGLSLLFQVLQTIRLVPDRNEDFVFV